VCDLVTGGCRLRALRASVAERPRFAPVYFVKAPSTLASEMRRLRAAAGGVTRVSVQALTAEANDPRVEGPGVSFYAQVSR